MKNYTFEETEEKTTYTVDELFEVPGIYARGDLFPDYIDYIVLQPGVGFYVSVTERLVDPNRLRLHHRECATAFIRVSAPSITFNF